MPEEKLVIEFDLSDLTLEEFALLDEWAFGRESFGAVLPMLVKCVTNDVDLNKLKLSQLQKVLAAFRQELRGVALSPNSESG